MKPVVPYDPWTSKKIIRSVRENLPVPIRGAIKLGTVQDDGKMSNEPYFIVDDLPEVIEVYGERPAELDILFPLDDIEKVAPSEYQMWAGGDKGMLVCSSDGPGFYGEPGEAIWRPRDREPPQGEILSQRNPLTGHISRVCHGQQCVDWRDHKGRPKCSQIMRMLFLLPRVSRSDVYLVTVRSWRTIRSVYSWLFHCQNTGIPLYNRVFTLYKEEQTVPHFDAIKNKEYKRNMPITLMRPNDSFLKEYGAQIAEAQKVYQRQVAFSFPEVEETQLLPPARDMSNVPGLDDRGGGDPNAQAEELLRDKDIQDAFRQLELMTKKTFSHKARLIAIRKKENEVDVKKAVIDQIYMKIQEAQQLSGEQVNTVDTTSTVQPEVLPEESCDASPMEPTNTLDEKSPTDEPKEGGIM